MEEDLEKERLARIADYNDCFNIVGWEEKPNVSPGSYSFHEAVHCLFLAHDSIERTLLDHPAIFHDKELYEKATEINQKLFDLYQAAASKHIVEPKV